MVWGEREFDSWPDHLVKCIEDSLVHLSPTERSVAEAMLLDRKQLVLTGILKGKKHSFLPKLLAIDPYFRLRWDGQSNMWAVDRVDSFSRCWREICFCPEEYLDQLPDMLAAGDMQRFSSPQAYLKFKRDESEKVRQAREAAADQRILEAIDGLSDKQVQQMVDVERAMITGEKIRPHGDDADFLNKVHEVTKSLPPLPDDASCINPGMNPKFQKELR